MAAIGVCLSGAGSGIYLFPITVYAMNDNDE